MYKNIFWQALLAVVFVSSLWFSVKGLYAYYSYSYLTVQLPLSSIEWTIEQKSEEKFMLSAFYSYEVAGKVYEGKTSLNDNIYRNRWGAEQAIKRLSTERGKVWVDSESRGYSSLEKKFPFKELVSAFFLWGLFLYFLWLGIYVAKFKN